MAVLRRAVDSGAAWQVQYGSLDTPLAKCNSVKLPRLLSSQAVTNIQLVKDAVKIKVLLRYKGKFLIKLNFSVLVSTTGDKVGSGGGRQNHHHHYCRLLPA